MAVTLTLIFRDGAFQSEMLPDLEPFGFDYVTEPLQANGHDLLQIQVEGDQVAIALRPMREAPDTAGLEACLRQLCADCELEFIALAPG